MSLKTEAIKANKWMEEHDRAMDIVLILGGIVLILIAFLPARYASFKAFMIGYAILPLPY